MSHVHPKKACEEFFFNTDLYTNTNWDTITKTRFIDIRTNHMFMRLDCNDNAYERYNIDNIRYEDYDAKNGKVWFSWFI